MLDKILAALAALLLIACGILLLLNANLRADLATARGNAAALERVNDELKARIDKQNAVIVAMRDAGEARAKAALAAVARAARTARRFAGRAARLETVKSAGDDCATARAVLRAYARGKS